MDSISNMRNFLFFAKNLQLPKILYFIIVGPRPIEGRATSGLFPMGGSISLRGGMFHIDVNQSDTLPYVGLGMSENTCLRTSRPLALRHTTNSARICSKFTVPL